MNNTSQAIDFQKYIFDKDVDTRIKSSRDDTLKIIQADIKSLDAKIEVLDAKVDKLAATTQADIKVLDAKIDGIHVSIKQGKTLNKWIFGMLVTLLLGLGGLAAAVLL